ncbi:MAG: hypothetical protein NT117_02510 [Gammaproteobacteria bacterium]|nr:hypothetical protein [Gammaproteobacteria bacterium]
MKRRIAIGLVIAVLAAGVLYTRSLRGREASPPAPTARVPTPAPNHVTGTTGPDGLVASRF